MYILNYLNCLLPVLCDVELMQAKKELNAFLFVQSLHRTGPVGGRRFVL